MVVLVVKVKLQTNPCFLPYCCSVHCSGSFFFVYFLLGYFLVSVLISMAFCIGILSSIYVQCNYLIIE